ncbi:MAG: hypothetical protein J7623_25710 [Chitinophaga sp.]|uniref:hypothetical protein n=1 Tax=Chitinophaga sp. TaxID=1869181 RepID=UPI001B1E3E9E|nr:hypothetical protein [Chitinophaga sp.]MBO9732064.1 hypothetical protein [Chitinophaga sp.]
MRKTLFVSMLILASIVACHKNDGPPIDCDRDTLYKVTTVMDIEGVTGGMAIADDGSIFYNVNNKIYKIKGRHKSLFAGGEAGFNDGSGVSARFNDLGRMAIDADNNLYVVDKNNHRIRKITKYGNVSSMVFSYSRSFRDPSGQIQVIPDTISDLKDIADLNVKGKHLYIASYTGHIIVDALVDYNAVQCRLDSSNYLSRGFRLYNNSFRSLDITANEKFLYWGNMFGIYKLDLATTIVTTAQYYDNQFVNFVLGEADSVVYKPRLDKCVIDRMSLATETDSLIAGQLNNSHTNEPHPSIDGIGTKASFNHIHFIKKKKNCLYIAEGNITDNLGAKIRKMSIP